VRIAQATKVGRWGKVRALQRLLTHSYSGKVLAVRRVTENAGKKTPGVDQAIWDTPEKKIQAVHALQRRGYQPQPLRRVYILKSDGKTMRPLGIPTMKDRSHQALHLLALDPGAVRGLNEARKAGQEYKHDSGSRPVESCSIFGPFDVTFVELVDSNTLA
jgi:RNA-directed DNA polymerase